MQYTIAVCRHWGTFLTSGILIALLGIWEHLAQRSLPPRLYLVIVFAGILVACYQAWRELLIKLEKTEAQLASPVPTGTEIAELKTALLEMKDECRHWSSLLSSFGLLQRGTEAHLKPSRWQSAVATAAGLSPTLHGELLNLEKDSRDIEHFIKEICSVPDSYRTSRSNEIGRVQQRLNDLASRALAIAVKVRDAE